MRHNHSPACISNTETGAGLSNIYLPPISADHCYHISTECKSTIAQYCLHHQLYQNHPKIHPGPRSGVPDCLPTPKLTPELIAWQGRPEGFVVAPNSDQPSTSNKQFHHSVDSIPLTCIDIDIRPICPTDRDRLTVDRTRRTTCPLPAALRCGT